MNSSHALIRRDPDVQVVALIQENSRAERGRWALVLSPSRTLNQVYTTLGNALEKQANRAAHKLGLGPQVVTQKIKSYFGSGEKRIYQLKLLHARALPSLPKLEKRCFKLLKYASPAESAQTQCRAFQNIVDLVTLLPGLRPLFLRAQFFDGATSAEDIFALWARHDNVATNADWEFWNNFAATCLSDSYISRMLQELSVRELTICDEQGLGAIERLLIERNRSGSSCCSSALCVRYLGGIMDLPGFWLNIGVLHSHVANKLCREMVLVLKDIGVDILVLGPIDTLESESPFDYDGVDFLAIALLAGLSTWFRKLDREDWSAQPWYESFTAFLLLLRRPRAAELLPRSSACAARDFENILSCVYEDAELTIKVVDGGNESGDTIHDDHLGNLRNINNSTISVQSRVLEQDDEHNPDSSSQSGGDSRSEGSDVDSLEASRSEADTSLTSNEESCNCIDQSDDADLHTQDLESNSVVDLIPQGEQMLTADEESVPQEISANPPHTSPPPPQPKAFNDPPLDLHASSSSSLLGSNVSEIPMTPMSPIGPDSLMEAKQKQANPLTDLIDTEKSYVDQLTGIIRKVAAAWPRSNLPPPELDTIFRSIEGVYKANRSLLAKLEEIGTNPSSPKVLGELLMRWIDDLEGPYTIYCSRFCGGFDEWEPVKSNWRLPSVMSDFSATNPPPIWAIAADNETPTWTLDGLFLLPKARLKYYRKLYSRLLNSTTPERSDHRLLVGALGKLYKLLDTLETREQIKVGVLQVPPELTMPISNLEQRLSTQRTLDIFTMRPKVVRLQISPPTLQFNREFRFSMDAVVRFTPRSTGIEVVHRQGHLFLLSDLFMVCERMSPEEQSQNGPDGTDMWLCYPPLAGKVLRVSEVEGQENAIEIAIMRREALVVQAESVHDRNFMLAKFKECIAFARSLAPTSNQPVPPMPALPTTLPPLPERSSSLQQNLPPVPPAPERNNSVPNDRYPEPLPNTDSPSSSSSQPFFSSPGQVVAPPVLEVIG